MTSILLFGRFKIVNNVCFKKKKFKKQYEVENVIEKQYVIYFSFCFTFSFRELAHHELDHDFRAWQNYNCKCRYIKQVPNKIL